MGNEKNEVEHPCSARKNTNVSRFYNKRSDKMKTKSRYLVVRGIRKTGAITHPRFHHQFYHQLYHWFHHHFHRLLDHRFIFVWSHLGLALITCFIRPLLPPALSSISEPESIPVSPVLHSILKTLPSFPHLWSSVSNANFANNHNDW